MDDRSTERASGRRATERQRQLPRYLVAALAYGLAVVMTVVTSPPANLLEHYGGPGLRIVGYVLIPLWLLSGTISLLGSARSGFWFAVSPILLGLAILGLANLF